MPGLYVGNYRDSKDSAQLEKYNITHILSIHDAARRVYPVRDIKYLFLKNNSVYCEVLNDIYIKRIPATRKSDYQYETKGSRIMKNALNLTFIRSNEICFLRAIKHRISLPSVLVLSNLTKFMV